MEPLSLDFLCTMVEGRRVGGDGDLLVQRVVDR